MTNNNILSRKEFESFVKQINELEKSINFDTEWVHKYHSRIFKESLIDKINKELTEQQKIIDMAINKGYYQHKAQEAIKKSKNFN